MSDSNPHDATTLHQLDTERSQPGLHLDTMSVRDLVRKQLDTDHAVWPALDAAETQITAAITAIAERMQRGGRLIYLGAGTPGRLAVLDAAECLPTFGVGDDVVTAVMAGGTEAMNAAVEGAEDDADAGGRDAETAIRGPHDVVVGISASGRTPYVLGAVTAARAAQAVTVGIANNAASELAAAVDYPIEVLTGPEFIAGSTRLKAGTAQKRVLNMISSIALTRMGKVHGNLMVDVIATNAKLRVRGQRIVSEATGASPEAAAAALQAADGNVKVAVASLLLDVDVTTAREQLAAHGGYLNRMSEDR